MAEIRLIFRKAAQERRFREEGYLVLPMLNADEIQRLQNAYSGPGPGNEGKKFHSTMMSRDPDYRRETGKKISAILEPRIREILKGYKILFANFIVKESGEGSDSGLHQDWCYTDENIYTAVNVWIPLSPLNEKNGRLHVIPGSHELPAPIRYTPYELPSWFHLKEKLMTRGIPCEVKPGEAVFYHPGILHFSPPNFSEQPRIAVAAVMIPKEAAALHYFRNAEKDPDQLEIFEVEEDFFNTHLIGERPNLHASLRGKMDFDHLSFTETQLSELDRMREKEKGLFGFFRKIFSI